MRGKEVYAHIFVLSKKGEKMLIWNDVIKYAKHGNPDPEKIVKKSDAEWKTQLSPEEYRVTSSKGTEARFTGAHCSSYEPGLYSCICCDTQLFDFGEKFDSGTGWPSFTQPATNNAVKYHKDGAFGMVRIEAMCNVCDAHLGHVFPDGPSPSGLRYCINSVSLKMKKKMKNKQIATFGGGCFWCIEAVIQRLNGVEKVASGYTGGTTKDPDYRSICSGTTDHAEVIQVTFDSDVLPYEDLITIFMTSHDPTSLNRQGADRGTQYRSAIFYHDEMQKATVEKVFANLKGTFPDPIVTQLAAAEQFYPAEGYHQDYYNNNPNAGYCRIVIDPKVSKLRSKYADKMKKELFV